MLYQVNYVIDDGYEWKRHVGVVEAKDKDFAKSIMEKYLEDNRMLRGENTLLNDFTVVTDLPSKGVIFNR